MCQGFCCLSDIRVQPRIIGSEIPVIVGKPHNITCLAEYGVWENISLIWTLAGKEIPGHPHAIVRHDDNIATLESMLNYDFTVGDENSELVCIIHVFYKKPPGECLYSTSEILDVQCKFSVLP